MIEESVKKVNEFKMAKKLNQIKDYKEHFPDTTSGLSKLFGKPAHQSEDWQAREVTGDSRNEQAMVMTLELSQQSKPLGDTTEVVEKEENLGLATLKK
jgi:hypothetical protein